MCGISGYYKLAGDKSFGDLARKMEDVQHHRGPDHFGLYRDEELLLGHNRLSIIDVSDHGHQPFENERYVLIFNGEIYNYKRLKLQLAPFDIAFHSTSDTEVLFHYLIRFGIRKTVKALRGMFAFAFYDKQEKTIDLARDRYGIKPLFYSLRNEAFAFASELKMFPHFFATELDGLRVFNALHSYSEALSRYTMLRDTFSLMPGQFVTFDRKTRGLHFESYYRLLDDIDPAMFRELDGCSPQEILRRTDKLMQDSVESMLMSDVPVGTFLSGGLDSSLISMYAKALNPDLQFFTADVVGPHSEVKYARMVAEHLQSPLYEHRHDASDFLAKWVFATWHHDFPIVTHTNCVPFAGVAAVASSHGVKVVLTGEGSDELFLGYPKMFLDEYRPYVDFPVRFLKSIYNLSPMVSEVVFPIKKNADHASKTDLFEAFEYREAARELAGMVGHRPVRDQKYLDVSLPHLNRHLRSLLHRNDRLGMSASLESRFPFLDEDLVKFAINLPVRFKGRHVWRTIDRKHPFLTDKWVVRELGNHKLPRSILQRSKMGFPVQYYQTMRVNAEYFRDSYLQDLIQLGSSHLQTLVDTQDRYFVSRLAAINIFGELFGRGKSVDELTEHVRRHVSLPAEEQPA